MDESDARSGQLTQRRVESFCEGGRAEADDVQRRGLQLDVDFAEQSVRRMLAASGVYSPSLDEIECLDANGGDSSSVAAAIAESESAASDGVLGVAFGDDLRVIDVVECSPASDCGEIELGDELCAFDGQSISDLLSREAGCQAVNSYQQLEASSQELEYAACAAGQDSSSDIASDARPSVTALLQNALRGRAGTYVNIVFSRHKPNATPIMINLHLRRESRQLVLRRMERRELCRRLETLFCDLHLQAGMGAASGYQAEVQRLHESNAALLLQLQSALALTREMQRERERERERTAAMSHDSARHGQRSSSPCPSVRPEPVLALAPAAAPAVMRAAPAVMRAAPGGHARLGAIDAPHVRLSSARTSLSLALSALAL